MGSQYKLHYLWRTTLARWAYRKYKKLRGHLRRATHWVARISRRDPGLFAHWQLGVRRGSLAGAV